MLIYLLVLLLKTRLELFLIKKVNIKILKGLQGSQNYLVLRIKDGYMN